MTPLELLKQRLKRLEYDKITVEDEISAVDKRRDELMDDFKNVGVAIIDLKAFIARNEEKDK